MGKPAVSLRIKLISLCTAALITCGLAPLAGFAQESVGAGLAPAHIEGSGEAATLASAAEAATPNSSIAASNEGSILASALTGSATSIISTDIALNAAEPLIGSFTVDGLTYSVGPDGLTLVAVDVSAVAEDGSIAIPTAVTYADMEYLITAIGPYAFYLSGVTQVELPATIASVDSRAFRSSDVERVTVDANNPNYASFDGALYDASLSRLLLIPEGMKGSVLLSCETEVVQASLFSHCSLVDAISVEEGGAAFSSWNGLLYDASGETLLRVPAGATEITIRDGCTTIAAGALEGCANLERINAPATITSISPDVFTSIPTVSLPASAVADDSSRAEGEAEVAPRCVVAESQGLSAPLALPDLGSTSASPSSEAAGTNGAGTQLSSQDEASSGVASGLPDQVNVPTDFIPQLTAMVALSTGDNDLPEVDPSAIMVHLAENSDRQPWVSSGFLVSSLSEADTMEALIEDASTYAANGCYAFLPSDCDIWSWDTATRHWVMLDPSRNTWTRYSGRSTLRFYQNKLWYCTSPSQTGDFGYICIDDKAGGVHTVYAGSSPSSMVPLSPSASWISFGGTSYFSINKSHLKFSVRWDAGDGTVQEEQVWGSSRPVPPQLPERLGFFFTGWFTQAEGGEKVCGEGEKVPSVLSDTTYYAQWKPYNVDFDTDSEPGDVDYPGEDKESVVAPDEMQDDGTVPIEDPKRPGYVFQGWVIPSADGTEAVDQELAYQDDDGKWYVDASKLPDYAGDGGRVELTARWTSVISVDVPQSVTFYADTVTQGQESREGRAEGAFGQNKVANQSQVDLRVVGLESSAVETTGTTLGADSVLKKAEAATPSTSAGKLLSLYPSAKQWTAEELQDPEAVGGTKAANAVDFDLDDILLEKSFSADAFTIPAGDTLNMGYRLNLAETGQQLDYGKLSTLEDGQSAAIANVSYCFAADALPSDWGEPLWVENPDRSLNPAKYLLLSDIKEAADDLSSNGEASEYYSLYKGLLDAQVMRTTQSDMEAAKAVYGPGPYFQLRIGGEYYPVQLLGICQDVRADGSKAGLSFQVRDVYAFEDNVAGGGSFICQMNADGTNHEGWNESDMRNRMLREFIGGDQLPGKLDLALVQAISPVRKAHQLTVSLGNGSLQSATDELLWLPSMFEVYGWTFDGYNDEEGSASYAPFQYQAYEGNVDKFVNYKALKTFEGTASNWWLRSSYRSSETDFCAVYRNAGRSYNSAGSRYGIAPCFAL